MSQTTIQQARFRRVEAEVLLPAGWLGTRRSCRSSRFSAVRWS